MSQQAMRSLQRGNSKVGRLRDARYPVAFFANGIGDSLLCLPALRALTDLFPHRITLLCPGPSYRLCYFRLPLRQFVELQWKPSDTGAAGNEHFLDPRQFDVRAAAGSIHQCDLFMSLVPWHSESVSDLVLRLLPHTTLGLFPGFTVSATIDKSLRHSTDLAFLVPQLLDSTLRLADYAQPPELPSLAWQKAQRLRGMLPNSTRLLVVHPDTAPAKCWLPERFTEVLEAFLSRHGDFFVFIVGRSYPNLYRGRYADRVVSCLGLPLDLSVGLVAQADLFLGVNSCMLHAADLFQVPGVGLFGPDTSLDSSLRWGFRFGPHRHVSAQTVAAISSTEVLAGLEDLVSD